MDTSVNDILIRIGGAIVIVLLGLIFSRIFSKLAKKILKEMNLDIFLKKNKLEINLERKIVFLIKYAVYFVALVFALERLGIAMYVLRIIGFGILFIILAFFVFFFKDLLHNLASKSSVNSDICEGDKVEIGHIKGKVIKKTHTQIQIMTSKNERVFIPNSLVRKNKVVKL